MGQKVLTTTFMMKKNFQLLVYIKYFSVVRAKTIYTRYYQHDQYVKPTIVYVEDAL